MKRSTGFLTCITLTVLVGLCSLPLVALAEGSSLVPAAQEASAAIGNNGGTNTDVTNWVTGEVSRVSLAVATVNQQPFTATPVRWFKKFKSKLKGEKGDPGPPGPPGPPGHAGGYSAVDGSAQTLNQTDRSLANPETFISLPVTTTAEGTFVVGFSSLTTPFSCLVGPTGPCGTIQVVQRIFIDGTQIGGGVRSSRVFEPSGSLDQYTTWTESASNIGAGAHTVEVRVSCIIPGTGDACGVGNTFKAGSQISTLWAMHPN